MSQQTKIRISFWAGAVAVFVLCASRLLPHPDNFTPIVAAALFGGAYFTDRRWAFALPLMAMVLSDIALELFSPYGGFHRNMFAVYACFIGFVGLGVLLRGTNNLLAPAGLALVAGSLFFIITNFSVWLVSGFYPLTLAGLVASYAAAIPFFGASLAGDIIWTTAVFGLWKASSSFGALPTQH